MTAHLRQQWATRIAASDRLLYRGLIVVAGPPANAEEARALVNRLSTGGTGAHWTTSLAVAKEYSLVDAYAHHPTLLPVILVAKYDPAIVQTDEAWLREHQVYDYDHGGVAVPGGSEREVPIRPGAKVEVTAVKVWRKSEGAAVGKWVTFPVSAVVVARLALAMPTTMYHLTRKRFVGSILEQGLRTDAPGWDTGYVWLSDSLEFAKRLAKGYWGPGPYVILAVDVTGLTVIPDPHAGWGDERDAHSFAVASSIGPERIRPVYETEVA